MLYKVFWTITASALSVALAVIPTVRGWPLALSNLLALHAIGGRAFGNSAGNVACAAGVLLICIMACHVARLAVGHADMFAPLLDNKLDRVIFLIRAAIVAYATWTSTFLIWPDQWLTWSALLILLSATVYVGALAEEYILTRLAKSKSAELAIPETAGIENSEHTVEFAKILAATGHPRVKVLAHSVVRDSGGGVIANQFKVQTPPTGR